MIKRGGSREPKKTSENHHVVMQRNYNYSQSFIQEFGLEGKLMGKGSSRLVDISYG